MAEPREITVKRWVCGGLGCTRSYSRKVAAKGHMETCWKVPENRACLSCGHFKLHICCDAPSYECGCGGERGWECKVGIPIAPGKPAVGCPQWEMARG